MDPWPDFLVDFVRWIKQDFGLVKEPTILGVHLDLPFRFGLMALLYTLTARKASRRWALGICLLVLIGKEVFDTFAVQTITSAHWPNRDDFIEVVWGVAGILFGEWLRRILEKRRMKSKNL